MLAAFKEELKRLAVEPKDPFHEKIKKRIGKRATQILEKRLRQMILLTPGLVRRIHRRWETEKAGTEVKKLGGFVLAYLYHPKDFLAEDHHGLFGYLDDAYLVAHVYEKVVEKSSEVTAEDCETLDLIQRTKKYVKAVIPEEIRKIEAMVESAVRDQQFGPFAEAFQGNSA